MAQKILFKRGTYAQVVAAGSAGTLSAGEPYLITDTGGFAVGTGPSTYSVIGPGLTGLTTSAQTELGVGSTISAGNSNSVSVGTNSVVSSGNSVAVGGQASVSAASAGSVTIGYSSGVSAMGGVAVGWQANVGTGGSYSAAIGQGAAIPTNVSYSVALGYLSRATTNYEVAIGNVTATPSPVLRRLTGLSNATATNDAVTLGQLNSAISGVPVLTGVTTSQVTALGTGASVTAGNVSSTALGTGSLIASGSSVAVGYNSSVAVTSPNSVALGVNAAVPTGMGDCVAIGYNSQPSAAHTVSVGNATATPPLVRRIVNVGDATGATDAATWGQVQAAIAAIPPSSGGLTGATSANLTELGVAQVVDPAATSSVVVGANVSVASTGTYNTVVGDTAVSSGTANTIIGRSAKSFSNNSSVVGAISTIGANSDYSSVLGVNTTIGDNSGSCLAIGASASLAGTGNTAIGVGTTVAAGVAESVAIGHNSKADGPWQVSFGNLASEQFRKITNILGGSANTDAASYGQLLAIANQIPPVPIINTSGNLASQNQVPLSGQFVYDNTNSYLKVGDGTHAYSALPYVAVNSMPYTKITVPTPVAGQVMTVQASGLLAPKDGPVVFTSKGVWGAAGTNKVAYTDETTKLTLSLTFAVAGSPPYSLSAYIGNLGLNSLVFSYQVRQTYSDASAPAGATNVFRGSPESTLVAAGSSSISSSMGYPGGAGAMDQYVFDIIDETNARKYKWEVVVIPNPAGAADGANILMSSSVTRTIL